MISLNSLPPELLQTVCSNLSNRDIKNLRATCIYLGNVAHLRLNRVFLSPHPRDLETLHEIAQSETYRPCVTELVYDDARFPNPGRAGWDSSSSESDTDTVPTWYRWEFRANCELLENDKGDFVEQPHHVETAKQYNARLSLKQSYALYQKIAEEQSQAIAAGRDIAALEHALKNFPNLQRITLTPIAHGVPFVPFYETPMIRHLPYGFIYPIPYPWPASESKSGAEHTYPPWEGENEKNKWRGLRVVLESLARNPHCITEFIVEVNQLHTGLSCCMFNNSSNNPEYKNFVSLLRTPGFSHLDLAISAGSQTYQQWPCFRSGLLRDALSGAKDLQHLSLSTAMCVPTAARKPFKFDGGGEEHYFPLRSIFPLNQWQNLRHFGLSRFIVKRKDLVDVLCSMPPTLRSVELSYLEFLETNKDHYREFLRDVRDLVNWRQRPVSKRPRLTILLESEPPAEGFCVDVSREVEDFVYRKGENPFGEDYEDGTRGLRVFRDSGMGVERDMFNSLNNLPFVNSEALMDMGILEPSEMYLQGIRPRFKSCK